MPQYIYIPTDGGGDVQVLETTETDPYKLFRDETGHWGTMLPTSYTSMFMFVVEEGNLYNLSLNTRANKFWWGSHEKLVGPAIIVMLKLVGEDVIKDFPTPAHLNRVVTVLNGG